MVQILLKHFDFEKEEDKEINTEFHNLSDLLITNEESLDKEDITLPPHHRCVSHTLNLIAVKDSERALENDPTYKKKWNSTFDSTYQLVTLLKDSSDKINHCLDYFNLQRLINNDVKFLDEYCQVMEPLARALDILQSDVGMYMGYLLPVLSSLQEKLKNIKNLTDCQSLVIAIQEGLNRRFCTIFEKKELIIASSLHPKFKLNWLNGDKKKLARAYLEDLLDIRSNESSSNSSKDNDYDDFFNFHGQSTSTSESGEEELTRFLKSKRSDVALLLDFPKLKKLFIKFNTALPSSASVERLFSIGNSVLSPSRVTVTITSYF
ncbi:uncharacterized protein LOC112638708 [Camponotus floridanus]|uniref:uncharacterized protein LOC112638708 n=1 Tax=Camponotus floridanus TaxID=104421 RepID=UPI000DC66A16|nr:uncharacterized protein LOC112638708 [Camponotus floridanus]